MKLNSPFSKLKHFFLRKPVIAFYGGDFIKKRLSFFKREIIINLEDNLEDILFYLKYSKNPYIIINKEGFHISLLKSCKNATFILNADNYSGIDIMSYKYGRNVGDFIISDINSGERGTNFKITYKGSSVPFWVNKKLGREEIEEITSFISLSVLMDANLVEVSKKVKSLEL